MKILTNRLESWPGFVSRNTTWKVHPGRCPHSLNRVNSSPRVYDSLTEVNQEWGVHKPERYTVTQSKLKVKKLTNRLVCVPRFVSRTTLQFTNQSETREWKLFLNFSSPETITDRDYRWSTKSPRPTFTLGCPGGLSGTRRRPKFKHNFSLKVH